MIGIGLLRFDAIRIPTFSRMIELAASGRFLETRRRLVELWGALIVLTAAGCGGGSAGAVGPGSEVPTVNGPVRAAPGTSFLVSPPAPLDAFGSEGGPFPHSRTYTLVNRTRRPVFWSGEADVSWVRLRPAEGVLNPGRRLEVIASVETSEAALLAGGVHLGEITFHEAVGGAVQATRPTSLVVDSTAAASLYAVPAEGLFVSTCMGGPFSPDRKEYTLFNAGSQPLDWAASASEPWTTVSPDSGNLQPRERATVTVSLDTASVNGFPQGSYSSELVFTNRTEGDRKTRRQVGITIKPAGLDEFPYFEKTGGALDYMGVSVTRTSSSQTVWAPGSSSQEYPGGWVTPGDYVVELNDARIHHEIYGTLTGQRRPGHVLHGTITDRSLLDPGWINHAFDDAPGMQPQEWGVSRVITLQAGDTLHVAYGNPVAGAGIQQRNGSDGMVVYCVAGAPDHRAGLWGTGRAGWSRSMWNRLQTRIIESASLVSVKTDHENFGPTSLPSPLPSDFAQELGVHDDNRQASSLSRWLQNRAFEKIQDGPTWQGNIEHLEALFEFFCNNVQTCFTWGPRTWSFYHFAHGADEYPPYQVDNVLSAVVAAVALGYDPDYEPLYRQLTHLAQRVDMTCSFQSNYTYANSTGANGTLEDHKNDNAFTVWLYYTLGHTDVRNGGFHAMNVWGPALWARELMGWPETPATADMLHKSGWAPGDTVGNITQHGHEWSSTGAPAGWEFWHVKRDQMGAMWLWFTDTEKTSQLARFARRSYLYKFDPAEPALTSYTQPGEDKRECYWALWCQDAFVDEPRGLAASVSDRVVTLEWTDIQDSDLSHYRVYRRSPEGLFLVADDVRDSFYVDSTGQMDGTHVYAVSAVDSSGNEGAVSDEVSVRSP